MKKKILLILISIVTNNILLAQNIINKKIDEVVVSANRAQSEDNITNVQVISKEEIKNAPVQTIEDLRRANVDVITIGQYLQPSKKHLPVKNFVNPEKFNFYKKIADDLGFVHVESGPLVRSSYKAQKHIT